MAVRYDMEDKVLKRIGTDRSLLLASRLLASRDASSP